MERERTLLDILPVVEKSKRVWSLVERQRNSGRLNLLRLLQDAKDEKIRIGRRN
jgi:hypothetical protein